MSEMSEANPQAPFIAACPQNPAAAIVLAFAHSGQVLPPDFMAQTRLAAASLRRHLEDPLVDQLFAFASQIPLPTLRARYARAYLDLNRAPDDLDPAMVGAPLPPDLNPGHDGRAAAGFGLIPRQINSGEQIYTQPLSAADIRRRIQSLHVPYHAALAGMISHTRQQFGHCLLLDCHSMPAEAAGNAVDLAIGNCYGASASAAVTDAARKAFAQQGLRVAINTPYAGGYTTSHYGQPAHDVHALQLEINRALYWDPHTLSPTAGFAKLSQDLERAINQLLKPVL